MADIQVLLSINLSTKDPSKNKKTSSWTLKNSSLKRPLQVSDTSKTSDSDSEPPNKPSNPLTLIKNAHSPATYQSEEESWRVFAFQQRCKEPSLSEEIIFTTFPSTTDTRRDTETSQFTALQLSQLRKVTSSSLVNADLSARQSASTF